MSTACIVENEFIPYIALERLDDSLENPEDKMLLSEILHEVNSLPQVALEAILRFAIAMGQESGTRGHVGVIANGGAVYAFTQLKSSLHNRTDILLLDSLVGQSYGVEEFLWNTILAFAMEKGKQSYRRWRAELDHAREQREETLLARKGLLSKLCPRFLRRTKA